MPRPDRLRRIDDCPSGKDPRLGCVSPPSSPGSSGDATMRLGVLDVGSLPLRRDLGKPLLLGNGAGSSSSLESAKRLLKSDGPSSSSSLESAKRLPFLDFLPPSPGGFLKLPIFKRELGEVGRSRRDWRIRPGLPVIDDLASGGRDEKEFLLKPGGERERKLKRLAGSEGEDGSRRLGRIDVRN